MISSIRYSFSAIIWQYAEPGGWYFVSLPEDISEEIRENLKSLEEGWGRMSARAEVNGLEWKTAIWYDSKRKTYILPLKAEIRKKAKISADQEIKVNVWV